MASPDCALLKHVILNHKTNINQCFSKYAQCNTINTLKKFVCVIRGMITIAAPDWYVSYGRDRELSSLPVPRRGNDNAVNFYFIRVHRSE